MDTRFLALVAIGLALVSAPVVAQTTDAGRFWGQWRGPEATGVARYGDPPTVWSETENIAWRVEIPGRGSASPIVWGDRVFLLTAVPVGEPVPVATPGAGVAPPVADRGNGRGPPAFRRHQFTVMAIDRATGEVAWQQVAREEVPHEGFQEPNGTYASGSAVTDGEHLFAFFGSWGLYAYDLDGNLQWEVDLGTRRTPGDQAVWRAGRHCRDRRYSLAARPRHAVRTVAAAV